MDDWKPKVQELAPGLLMGEDKAPHAVILVGQLHKVLWPMYRIDHEQMSPQQVWEECLREVQRLKENQRG